MPANLLTCSAQRAKATEAAAGSPARRYAAAAARSSRSASSPAVRILAVSAGPLQKVVEIAGPGAVRQVLHDVLEADRKPDGELRRDNVFRYVVAAKE